jgi:hypothetical protein
MIFPQLKTKIHSYLFKNGPKLTGQIRMNLHIKSVSRTAQALQELERDCLVVYVGKKEESAPMGLWQAVESHYDIVQLLKD